jgi:hypothetical protein
MSRTQESVDEGTGRRTFMARSGESLPWSRSRRRAAASEASVQYTQWMISTRIR